jgi:hypothetical protein
VHIFLNNTGVSRTAGGFLDEFFNFFEVFGHCDVFTLITVFSWLDNPNVFVAIIFDICGFTHIEVGFEFGELGVVCAPFHVEGHGKGEEGVLTESLVIVFEVHEQGLLVRQVVIIVQFVVQLTHMRQFFFRWFGLFDFTGDALFSQSAGEDAGGPCTLALDPAGALAVS